MGRIPPTSRRTPFVLVILILGLLSTAPGRGAATSQQWSLGYMPGGLDLSPSRPMQPPAAPGGAGSLELNPAMLSAIFPPIPNLEFGYELSFGGDDVRAGRLTLDYLKPLSFNRDSTWFAETHLEAVDFFSTLRAIFHSSYLTMRSLDTLENRLDFSVGGGYRRLLNEGAFFGLNAFFDATRFAGEWHTSGGLGVEMAALLGGGDAVDLNFNWYGSFYRTGTLVDAFRHGPRNFDISAGYSREILENGPDLRLSLTGYSFAVSDADRISGLRCGAELKTRNGLFSLKAETGKDEISGRYYTVGGYLNAGLDLENLLQGSSPFTMPEPLFRSPRNLRRMLTRKVGRNWHQPASAVVRRDWNIPLRTVTALTVGGAHPLIVLGIRVECSRRLDLPLSLSNVPRKPVRITVTFAPPGGYTTNLGGPDNVQLRSRERWEGPPYFNVIQLNFLQQGIPLPGGQVWVLDQAHIDRFWSHLSGGGTFRFVRVNARYSTSVDLSHPPYFTAVVRVTFPEY